MTLYPTFWRENPFTHKMEFDLRIPTNFNSIIKLLYILYIYIWLYLVVDWYINNGNQSAMFIKFNLIYMFYLNCNFVPIFHHKIVFFGV